MAEVFKPTFKDKRTGEVRQTKYWYARINGRRVPLKVTDKRVAERKAADLERLADFGHDPARLEKARRTPLADHMAAFEASLRGRGVGDRHLANLLPRLRRLLGGCGFRTLADVDAGRAERWIGRQARGGRPMSAQWQKHVATHALQFGRWLVAAGAAARNPFAGLAVARNVAADRRHERRPLTDAECDRLLAAVRASGAVRGRMDPAARTCSWRSPWAPGCGGTNSGG